MKAKILNFRSSPRGPEVNVDYGFLRMVTAMIRMLVVEESGQQEKRVLVKIVDAISIELGISDEDKTRYREIQ